MKSQRAARVAMLIAFVLTTAISLLLIPVFLCIGIMWIEPSLSTFALLILLLAVVIALAAFERGASIGNGFGTALRGNYPTPNGHIATKWVVLFYAPLIPIRSYEISSTKEVDYQNWLIGYSRTLEFRYRPLKGGRFILATGSPNRANHRVYCYRSHPSTPFLVTRAGGAMNRFGKITVLFPAFLRSSAIFL